ncbi:ser/thr kinase [Yokapox virus]|uniref:non-specific serine/threonine protein kinase n=1 Tax=Yokapox virus TaxID=1076255 RepID=G3EI51_9POXV|nr:ser/thr kinase [Yokapox virus]AEN03748.1 ser/thr kinase [Yokapox virus]
MDLQGKKITDNVKTEWIIGCLIGTGGFGSIYTTNDSKYVVKIEPKSNGPLFTEQAFYTRILKSAIIEKWKMDHSIKHVGVIKCKSFGTFNTNIEYRFLIIDRLGISLDEVIKANNNKLPMRSVVLIGVEMINTLQFIHDQGYSHGDIKSGNIVLDQSNKNKLYLIDYGLVSKYISFGKHVMYVKNPNKMHNGTLEFTSIDAHNGYVNSRRGDLEILGYCMIKWLGGMLPWSKVSEKKKCTEVRDLKIKYYKNTENLLMTSLQYIPKEILYYIHNVNMLKYDESPNYDMFRNILLSYFYNKK